MRTIFTLPLVGLALIAIAGCSPKAQNETAQAADTIAADANATMVEAANDTEAASDRAFGSGEAMIDNGAAAVQNATGKAKQKTGQAMRDMGNEIEE
ncbi:hypothetical protein U1839_13980 [Sphingomonas sp. RT2P30]|uniref:hypothetical protein n=1 Tax=Parasphingomonas halimpatiens TaxID=3096162 RepID=UPI002FCC73BB